jgi:hypothetical protein
LNTSTHYVNIVPDVNGVSPSSLNERILRYSRQHSGTITGPCCRTSQSSRTKGMQNDAGHQMAKAQVDIDRPEKAQKKMEKRMRKRWRRDCKVVEF